MTTHDRLCHPDLELRVTINGEVIFGPVQAMLLEAIHSTGSISAAHRQLGMSYAHVWNMVAALNDVFFPPVIDPVRGGRRGGGAVLTQEGHKVLSSYQRLEELSHKVARTELLAISNAVGINRR